ncbi:hypothetical protein COT30_02495 [Candidatus Micrarchaeota archaeon CG08_land_8_20_14_0_20_49_17]|nr:MAG: hypothetical protein AUJ13_02985 [Candidatus Micrarchaeota archaeon CG1_02_49_24]PIU09804.1 MAG: hypothetical protein COT30_02495 [Candidatus Micrarchaeota archaeon CG08_land_8_20_14_0_20_49_17]PIZ95668.1 MAG: hypothetical protein COX84_04285 [Candidatus Micrarchaeota archaeon CG_4_10_14_0_2_um_filter_49_7]HII53834.1 hypothetical protein [Candidatus Micrarchaeota archaeon]
MWEQIFAEADGYLNQIPTVGHDTFCISTRIPLPILVEEEKALDYQKLKGKACLKKRLNDCLAKAIAKKTGKPYEINGDIRFIFNFIRHKLTWEYLPIYIFGRYNKLSRGLAQSKWHCIKCAGKGCDYCKGKGRMYDSVEEIVAGYFSGIGKGTKLDFTKSHGLIQKKLVKPQMASRFHASGREDVDARMLGPGRPFALEIENPLSLEFDLGEIEKKINQREDLRANGLRKVSREFVELVDQSHFDKEYDVFVDCEGEVSAAMVKELNSIADLEIAQQTPERVLHRRADLVRRRVLRELKCTQLKPNLLKLHLVCEAGFYVKEFVYSDNGRTNPSLASLLEMKCTPRDLDVVKIRDGYLDFMLHINKI